MKKMIWNALLLAVLMTVGAACGSGAGEQTNSTGEPADSAGQSPGAAVGEAAEKIKIGYIGALSGGSATMGIPGKNGIELAVEEINSSGGINGKMVELIALDDKADPAASATQAQKLINDDKVVAIIGGPNSGTVKANSQVIAQYKVPEIISIAQEDTLIDPESPTFATTFSMTENNSYDVRAISQYMKSQGYQKIGVIADNTAYGQGGIKTIEKIMAEEGIEIAQVVDHPVGVKDLTAQVLKLRGANVDAVYVYSLGPEGALFMKTTKQVNWSVPVVGGRGLNMKAFVDLAGDAANGMVLPSVVDASKPAAQEFIRKYDEKYGDDPAHVYSVLGYDAMRILAEALKQTDGAGGAALVQALENLQDFPTVSGGPEHKASYSKDKHYAVNDNFVVFNVVNNGQFEMLTNEVESGW
jgi:branched-chain amino acid transport system substrate-binding protein